ncbi:MAG TPA: hypothetical protein VGC97_07830 [Pyrinomonadaceae bacterium]|jgi:hypothetical protein
MEKQAKHNKKQAKKPVAEAPQPAAPAVEASVGVNQNPAERARRRVETSRKAALEKVVSQSSK